MNGSLAFPEEWSVSLYDCSTPVFAINNSSWMHKVEYNISSCIPVEHTANLEEEWIHIIGVKDKDQVKYIKVVYWKIHNKA